MQLEEASNILPKEAKILSEVDSILENGLDGKTKDELISHFQMLRDSYSDILSKQIKFIRLADSSQGKLRKFQVELDETNKKINAQNEELTKLNQTKDKFFSIVSHDIRNPLTAIMLMGELLKSNVNRMSSEQLNAQVRKISDSTKLLHELFENLHRWSKSQSGILDFNPEEFNLLIVINKVLELSKVHAENKEIELISDIEPTDLTYGDKNMIETVVRNLVSNAIKFTNKGGVVKVSHRIESKSGNNIICISDDGIGMSEDIMNKLFVLGESSVKKKGTAKEPGSGLGLILCKEFVGKHGGEIWVESKEGEGSSFHFSIPPHSEN